MSEIILETKLVGSITGDFFIPSYQRGYRWHEEVETLLDDLINVRDGENYCLQPIVVKRIDETNYELIDGQQRLPSIYLIQKFIKTYRPKMKIKYSIRYETRADSKEFLDNLDVDNLPDSNNAKNVDEYFFIEAAKTISEWLQKQDNDDAAASKLQALFDSHVHIIWYQVDNNEDSTALFTRLNIGKIPLTNAELVKALFLSRNNGIEDRDQLEIATEWDLIEKELHEEAFWAFITNKKAELYPTRIELLFDLMSNKPEDTKEKLYTFYYFSDEITAAGKNSQPKKDIWKRIKTDFQHIKEWYEDRELYHKIGYLVATDSINLNELIKTSEKETKTDIRNSLDKKIAETIDFTKDYADLSYETDSAEIERLLLLFNVETVRTIKDASLKFTFSKHKDKQWSLEHIHAQQSEGMSKQKQWAEWLRLHLKSLKALHNEEYEDLINRMEVASKDEKLTEDTFNTLYEEALPKLSEDSSVEYKHMLSNMALLGVDDNAALNNSTFDVKRNKI